MTQMRVPVTITEQEKSAARAGLIAWSGHKLAPMAPVARTLGKQMLADLLLED